MQVKVSLDQDIYDYLKKTSAKNRRTLSAELNTILEEYINKPETPATPAPGLYYPPGVRSPENPEGRPTITNEYNSYYKTAPRKTIID